MYKVVNPANGEEGKTYPDIQDSELKAVLAAAEAARQPLKDMGAEKRAAMLNKIADLHQERRDELAQIITREMGKPIEQARGEVDICVSIYKHYAEHGPEYMKDEPIEYQGKGDTFLRREAVGTLVGIMPWNFPYYQVARFAGPNLMLGNPIMLKHAPQDPEASLAIEQIMKDAGVPEGGYANIFASNDQIADLLTDPRVHGISVTGSERAGMAVAAEAGKNLKKVVLEMGGSDPFIVLDDVDVSKTVKKAVSGRVYNTGQACNAAKRFIVQEKVYDQFVKEFVDAMKQVQPSDPMEDSCQLGPMSSQNQLDTLQGQLDTAKSQGATVLLDGGKIDKTGCWFAPVVLADVTPEMDAYHEELFGPISVIYRVTDDDDAVRLANDSSYGLGSSIQSADTDRALALGDRLETGMVYINEPGGTAAELPFGGVKRSGFGRELGRYGMEEFVNKKLMRVRP